MTKLHEDRKLKILFSDNEFNEEIYDEIVKLIKFVPKSYLGINETNPKVLKDNFMKYCRKTKEIFIVGNQFSCNNGCTDISEFMEVSYSKLTSNSCK